MTDSITPPDPGQQSIERLCAGHPLALARLKELMKLEGEVVEINASGILPDGDSVNISTSLWAEGWARKAIAEGGR